jgi:hypothetical protein
MNYVFSKHALEQLKIRNITEKSVNEIVEYPKKTIEFDECIKIYQAMIEPEKLFLLRVFINTCKEPAVIITVYKTSKIKKYHES